MPLATLTDVSVRHLKPVPGKQVIYGDKTVLGFGVRVTETGSKSYVLTYGANRQRVKIGDVGVVKLVDARNAARNILAEKQLGHHARPSAPTFRAALDIFLEEKAKVRRPRTVKDYKRLLTRHGFGEEKLNDITPTDIQRKLDKLKSTPSERAHTFAALKIFFRFAYRRHFLDHSPIDRIAPVGSTKSRSRVLTPAEIKAIWHACTGRFGGIVRLCLLTGARRSEVAHFQASWIVSDLLTIPSEVAKNGIEATLPLGPLALTTIREHRNNSPYLFPATRLWRGRGTVYNAWGKDKPKLDKAAGVTGWVLHDLRRTFATLHAQIGTPPHIIERLLNHITGTIKGVALTYNRYAYIEEMNTATLAFEAHLSKIIARG